MKNLALAVAVFAVHGAHLLLGIPVEGLEVALINAANEVRS
jgi:hypothetical protein